MHVAVSVRLAGPRQTLHIDTTHLPLPIYTRAILSIHVHGFQRSSYSRCPLVRLSRASVQEVFGQIPTTITRWLVLRATNRALTVGLQDCVTGLRDAPVGQITRGKSAVHKNISRLSILVKKLASKSTSLKKASLSSDSAGIRTRVRRRMLVASAYDTPTLLNRVLRVLGSLTVFRLHSGCLNNA
jgi:hypothetical protein